MAGIIDDKMAATEAEVPMEEEATAEEVVEEAPAEEEMPEEEGAEPEDQEAYERVVLAGLKIIYDPKTAPDILSRLQKGAQEPAMALASTTLGIMQALQSQAQQPIPEEIVIFASGEIISELSTIAEGEGLFTADETVLARAAQEFISMGIESKMLTPEFVQQILGEFDETQTQQMVAEQEAIAGGQQQPAMEAM